MAYCSPGAEGVLCANRGPLIFAFGSCRGPLGGLKNMDVDSRYGTVSSYPRWITTNPRNMIMTLFQWLKVILTF